MLIIFFLPSQFGKYFFFDFSYLFGVRVDYLAIKFFLIDVLIFLFFLFNFKKIIIWLMEKKFLFFYFILLLNLLLAKNKFLTGFQIIKIFEFLILFFLAKIYFLKTDKKAILLVLFFSSLIEVILSVYQLVFSHSVGGIFYFYGERLLSLSTPAIAKIIIFGKEFLRPYGSFSHPNSLAGFYLLLYFFVLTEKSFQKNFILKWLTLLNFNVLIFFSFSKIAIFSFLILNSVYFLKNLKTNCFFCKINKIFIPVFLALIFLSGTTDILTIEKRLVLIKNSFVILKNNLFFGVGLNNYLVAQSQLKSSIPLFFNQPVHNIFLLILTELGLIGFIGMIFMFFKNKKIFLSNYYLLFVILLTGFFDHYWWSLNQNFLLASFVYGSFSSSFSIDWLRSKS
ncbi:MAG: O-antigen ligase family protein [Microgenomates group bacterium]